METHMSCRQRACAPLSPQDDVEKAEPPILPTTPRALCALRVVVCVTVCALFVWSVPSVLLHSLFY